MALARTSILCGLFFCATAALAEDPGSLTVTSLAGEASATAPGESGSPSPAIRAR